MIQCSQVRRWSRLCQGGHRGTEQKKKAKCEMAGLRKLKVGIDIDVKRLAEVSDASYCGRFTVRDLAAVAAYDKENFPLGLDTPIGVGDFEGNFQTNVLGIGIGGGPEKHLVVMCDPHGQME